MKSPVLILFALFTIPLGSYLADCANHVVHEHRNKELRALEAKNAALYASRYTQLHTPE
ncbi:hypothetical protein [Lacipirellula parvula]|uniref:Uncharacterized protein n=1 Tax=Lacipirellula parvula TaxID=2650471 RepID=A0A5K7XMW5_9BACT|nr:hypothetical protein [Lacipirellula parvula]BBO34459.1 hypothetical protein PLANPX_4071 [Lacipirellula parvula]